MNLQPSDVVAGWWHGLQPYFADGRPNPRADRAGLARLRRASVLEAMCEPAAFALLHRLGGSKREFPAVALCAAVLATVTQNERGIHPARALGPLPGGDAASARMSPLRFRRLIDATEPEDRLLAFRRAVALSKGVLNVRWLAGACLDWSDRTRRDWIFRYHNAAAAPDAAGPGAAGPGAIDPKETDA